MTKNDLQREMQWAFAKILLASDRLKTGRDLPAAGSVSADAQVREWARANVVVMAAAAMKLFDSYETGRDTCENCGQLMQRSYPLGSPGYVLCCRGCGTNMNHVQNPDMRYTENLYATTDSPDE